MKLLTKFFNIGSLSLISLLLLFTRPFVGLSIFGYRLGELLIVFGFLISIFSTFVLLYKPLRTMFELSNASQLIFSAILISFYVSTFLYDTNLFASYTYKMSSYIWSAGYLLFGIYLFQEFIINRKNRLFLLMIILPLPFIHYFFSTGYYPNFIIDFFKINSDKFEFTKASDIMLTYVVSSIFSLKYVKSRNFNIYYIFIAAGILLPLLIFMSRGSFMGVLLFLVIFSLYNLSFFRSNVKKSFILIAITGIVFVLSTYNVNGTEINYSFNFGEEEVKAGANLSITENIKEIARKDEQRNAFLSLYYDNGRIYSLDQTTNWRLDIWQDVVEDLNSKSLIFKGYGYNEIIPVMTDPSAPGRLGRDGLNEHVHNYFVNIFARGGIFQFLLFMLFHLSIILIWKRKYNNYTLVLLTIPVFFTSALDMSMEGVQFPIVFYLFLAFLIQNGFEIKIKK